MYNSTISHLQPSPITPPHPHTSLSSHLHTLTGVSVSLSEPSVAVSEEEGVVTVDLVATGAHTVPVTASVTTISGSAIGIIMVMFCFIIQ